MECSVCNEAYNETDFKPHSLNPCGHCFCIKCINSLPNKVCPICRQSIQSTILNFAILEMVRDRIPIARPNLNFMSEINDMKKSLNGSLNKKQLEWRKYIDQMREKISKDTEDKLNRLLNDNAELMSQLDEVSSYGESRLVDLNHQAETELEQFEQNLSGFSLNSNRLILNVSKRIKELVELNLDEFKIELELGKSSEENQIGKIGRVLICGKEEMNKNDEVFSDLDSDTETENEIFSITNNMNDSIPNTNIRYKRCKINLSKDSESGYGFTMDSKLKANHMIYSVEPCSPAYNANVRDTDIILEINKINIKRFKHEQVKQMIIDSKKDKQIELLLIRKEDYLLYKAKKNY